MYSRHKLQQSISSAPGVARSQKIGGAQLDIEITPKLEEEDPHVYLNLNLTNGGRTIINADFSQQYPQAILDNPSEWQVTVARFSMPARNIPIKTFPTRNTGLFVTVEPFGGPPVSSEVLWTGEVNDKGEPQVYCIYDLLRDINAALDNSWGTALPLTTEGPFFTFEPSTGIFAMNGPVQAFPSTAGPGSAKVWISTELTYLFAGFEGVYNGVYNPDYRDFNIYIYSRGNNPYTIAGTTYYKMDQQGASLSAWVDLRGYIITSSALGCRNEWISLFNNALSLQNSVNATKLPVVTDFQIVVDNQSYAQQLYQFVPFNVNNRLIDLLSSSPLFKLDLQVYWYDASGVIRILQVGPQETVNIKLLFKKR